MKTVNLLIISSVVFFLLACEQKSVSVSQAAMQKIYDEVKTPYKYGLVVVPADNNHKMDCPTVFRKDGKWYMSYLVYDGKAHRDGRGYETWLAESDDLLVWNTLGRILPFPEEGSGRWDENELAGYISLIDYQWGGTYEPQQFDGKYWLSYFGSTERGYENGRLEIGVAYTAGDITTAHHWNTLPKPVLSPADENRGEWENTKLYKSSVIWDKNKTFGHPFVMYYNAGGIASGETNQIERIGIALSDEMLNWKRYPENPVLSHDEGIQYEYITVDAPFPMEPLKIFQFPKKDFVITDYGARDGGVFDNTKAIAVAIDACNKADGGRVVVPPGSWFTGPIHFKSNVNLHLEEGSVLIFSDNPADYLPEVKSSLEGMEIYNYSPLIYAYECENIAITGKGFIMPKMDKWREWFPRRPAYMSAAAELFTMMSTQVPVEERRMAFEGNTMRPYLIHFNRSKNILLDGFTIRESPFWCIHLFMCDGGVVRNIDVKAHGHNNDGIDLEMSRNFLVENCIFDQGDDAVVIKSGSNQDGWRLNSPCENIVVRNCTILEGHTLLALGSELSSGIRNIYMHDCTAPESVHRFLYIKTNHRRGGFVENIYMENLKSGRTRRVFEIDTDVLYQWRNFPTYETRITRIDGVHIKNIECDQADAIFEIKGDERLPVRNITLENIHVNTVKQFISNIENAENVVQNNVIWNKLIEE